MRTNTVTNETVLVTGSAGFIGANVVRRLVADGAGAVFAAVRPGSNTWRLKDIQDRVHIVEIDLLDQKRIESELQAIRPTAILHLATHGGYAFQQSVRQTLETNFFGTVHLVQAAEKVGLRKLIATGSSSEYGRKDAPMRESDLLEPNTPYGVSKAAATLFCQHYARERKLPIAVLRPFSVYGPWEDGARLIPTLILRALRGQDLELVSPTVARDFVYVGDVVEAYQAALRAPAADGHVINVCTGAQETLADVARQVTERTGRGVKTVWGTYESRSFDTDRWVGDGTKARELLGWQARTTLSEGIAHTVAWFREESLRHPHYATHA